MATNPLAYLFDGVEEVHAQIAHRREHGTDHRSAVDSEVALYHPRKMPLRVAEVIVETPTCKTFRLRREDGERLPPFSAGQYVSLHMQVGEVLTSRAFSISSSPLERDHYDVTVRRVPNGRVSNHMMDNLVVGDTLRSGGPIGAFYHDPIYHGDDLVFLAGGSGVAPALSMAREIAERGLDRRLHVIYGSRRTDDVLFRDELDALVERCAGIRVDHVISEPDDEWTGAVGFLSGEVITELAGPLAGRMTYVCGPPAMYSFLLRELDALGHPRRRIRLEANGVAKPPETDERWPAGCDPTEEVEVTVRGRGTIKAPRNRPLLDVLEDNGIRPEASCRSGECAFCRVRVVSGEVFNAEEAKLRLSDERFGFVHCCVAYPLTDIEIDI